MRTKGFTLIELMIVIVIVALIAAIALPNYQNYVVRSYRAVAKAELLEVAAKQEHFFLNNKAYANTLAQLAYPTDLAGAYFIDKEGLGMNAAGATGIYSMTLVVPADGLSFTVTATPVNTQLDRDLTCGALSLDDRGTRTSLDPTICWAK